MARGVQIFFNNCTDPKRQEEYNRWYSHTHLPDLQGANGLVRARRFVNAELASSTGQYLTMYDFESDDLVASTDDLVSIAIGLYPQGRHIDCLQGLSLGTYCEIDPTSYAPLETVDYPKAPAAEKTYRLQIGTDLSIETLPRALLIVMTNCNDAGRDEEYNRWYSHVHLPDVKPATGMVSATRYRRKRGPSEYMALYEFEGHGIAAYVADFQRLASGAAEAGRRIDVNEGVGLYFFVEIDESSYEPLPALDYPRERTVDGTNTVPTDLYAQIP